MACNPIPWGYKFRPEDHELIFCLACKADGIALPWPCEGLIKEVDLFCLPEPGILFQRTQCDVVYIFTKLRKVAEDGKRFDRNVLGKMTWKGVDSGKPIRSPKGLLVGEKKNFVLMDKAKMKLGYNMTEFSLNKHILKNSKFNDYVLCQIRKNDKMARSFTNISEISISNEGDSVAPYQYQQVQGGQQCPQFSEQCNFMATGEEGRDYVASHQSQTHNFRAMLLDDDDEYGTSDFSDFLEPELQ